MERTVKTPASLINPHVSTPLNNKSKNTTPNPSVDPLGISFLLDRSGLAKRSYMGCSGSTGADADQNAFANVAPTPNIDRPTNKGRS